TTGTPRHKSTCVADRAGQLRVGRGLVAGGVRGGRGGTPGCTTGRPMAGPGPARAHTTSSAPISVIPSPGSAAPKKPAAPGLIPKVDSRFSPAFRTGDVAASLNPSTLVSSASMFATP